MHCECCDHLLDDLEATAKFAESGNFVNMCRNCQKWLPKDIRVITRTDLKGKKKEEPTIDDPFDLQDYNDEPENWD